MSLKFKLNPLQAIITLSVGLFSYFSYKTFTTINSRINKLENSDHLPNSEISDSTKAEINDRIDVIQTRVTASEKRLSSMASHEQRISSLGVRVSEMQDYGQRIFQVEHSNRQHNDILKSIEGRLEVFESDIQEKDNCIKELKDKVKNLETIKPIYTFLPARCNGYVTEQDLTPPNNSPNNSPSTSKDNSPKISDSIEHIETPRTPKSNDITIKG